MNATAGTSESDVSAGGFRWSLFAAALQAYLLDETGAVRLQEWLESGAGPSRQARPVIASFIASELPGLSLSTSSTIWCTIGAPGCVSWRAPARRASSSTSPLAAAARGIPTIYPIAVAEQETRVGSGESILITRSLEDTTPLHFFLAAVLPTYPEPRATRLRQRLAQELGTLVARDPPDAGILCIMICTPPISWCA